MLTGLIDKIAGTARPLRVRGKGRLLNRWVPFTGTRKIVLFGRFPLQLDLANAQQRQIFMGCLALDVEQYFRPLLRPGDTFVDVGANLGYFSMLAATLVGPSGRVISFEPNPVVFAKLKRALEEGGATWATPVQSAVSDAEGTLTLHVPPESDHADYNVTILPREGFQPVTVPARTISDLLRERNVDRVQLMKIDVEGAESKVFGGASALADGLVRHIVCEINGFYLKKLGSTPAELVGQIEKLGFLPATLSGGKAVPVPGKWTITADSEFDGFFMHRSAVEKRN